MNDLREAPFLHQRVLPVSSQSTIMANREFFDGEIVAECLQCSRVGGIASVQPVDGLLEVGAGHATEEIEVSHTWCH